MFVVFFIVVILGSVILHEFGHFLTAKAFNMRATEFFVGFGPRIWSFRRGETEYGLKAIPAGGYVKITGMTPWEETDVEDDGRFFYQQAPWKRFIVLVAGSFTHLVLAIVLLFAALAFIGLPTLTTTEIADVVEDSPAVGQIEVGDEIVAIDGAATPTFDDVRGALDGRAGDTVDITVQRDGVEEVVPLTFDVEHPAAAEDPSRADDGFLGVAPVIEEEPLGVGEGLQATFSGDLSIWRLFGDTFRGLGQVFGVDALGDFFASATGEQERGANSVTSLVGAGQIVNEFGTQGDVFAVLTVLASLQLVLGILNLLPLPPFDGGHVATMAVEEVVNLGRRVRGGEAAAKRYHLNPAVITPIALTVLAFFVILAGTALYLDIVSPASELVQ